MKTRSGKTHTSGNSSHTASILILMLAVFFSLAGCSKEDATDLTQYDEPAATAVAEVKAILRERPTTYWIHDTEDNLIAISKEKNSNITAVTLTPNMQKAFLAELCPDSVEQIKYEDIGTSDTNQRAYPSSLGWHVAGMLASPQSSPTCEAYIAHQLDKQLSTEELLQYIAVEGTYLNTYTGIGTTSAALFGKQASALNEAQLSFLAFTLNGSEQADLERVPVDAAGVDSGAAGTTKVRPTPQNNKAILKPIIESFLTKYSKHTEEELQFITSEVSISSDQSFSFWQDEINALLADSKESGDYSVRVGISSQVQASLQLTVNNTLKPSIAVGTDGQYLIDASIAVYDWTRGYLISNVSNRSCREKRSAPHFQSNLIAQLDFARSSSKSGNTPFTLTQTDEGFISVKEQCKEQPAGKGLTAYDCLARALQSKSIPCLISMRSPSGAEITIPAKQWSAGVDKEKELALEMFRELDTLLVKGDNPSVHARIGLQGNLVYCIIAGSTAVNHSLTSDEDALCANLVNAIEADLSACADSKVHVPPRTPYVEERLTESYAKNQETLTVWFEARFSELSNKQIVSKESSKAFVTGYRELLYALEQYKDYMIPDTYGVFCERLYELRQGVSETLLKYAT